MWKIYTWRGRIKQLMETGHVRIIHYSLFPMIHQNMVWNKFQSISFGYCFSIARYSTVRDELRIEIRNNPNREQNGSSIDDQHIIPNHNNQFAGNSNGSYLQVENGT